MLSSSDSDIRFTRKNLGDNERCGCALIAGFLAALLLAGAIIYIGCEYITVLSNNEQFLMMPNAHNDNIIFSHTEPLSALFYLELSLTDTFVSLVL